MNGQQSSYRQIMKATSIFGGVQIVNILVGILRSKFIAIFLGPTGMGISGLLTSTIAFISSLTSFGLSTSAVRDVALAYATGNNEKISFVCKVFMRWIIFTGLVGTLLTAIFSSWISDLVFGNKDYALSFVIISITLFLNQFASGNNVVLRGMRKITYLAKSSIYSGIIALIITIPIYYFYGINGIVPGILIISIVSFFLSFFYARKISFYRIKITIKTTFNEGKSMIKLGFIISISGFATLSVSYVLGLFISSTGGLEQLGLYNAGFAIINTYVGMIFTSMSSDFYPRLSSVSESNIMIKEVVNQQAEIAILILSPILLVFVIFIDWLIVLLYSNNFIAIDEMLLYAALGMFFKAASWPIGYIFLAKSANKVFLRIELITNICLLVFNIIGYKYFGLKGLGLSFLLSYFSYLIHVTIISKRMYSFTYSKKYFKIFGFQFVLALFCLLLVNVFDKPFTYIFGTIIILLSTYISLVELNKRMDLRAFIRKE